MTTSNNKVNQITNMPETIITELHPTRMQNYRLHLRTITNGLIEMAKAAGRSKYTCNQLLRECYNLVDAELKTFDQWKEEGAFVPILGSPNHQREGISILSSRISLLSRTSTLQRSPNTLI